MAITQEYRELEIATPLGKDVLLLTSMSGAEQFGRPFRYQLQLGRIGRRTQENHKVLFSYEDEVVDLIASRCTDVESGARVVDAILNNTLLPEIGQELLTRLMEGKTAKRVHSRNPLRKTER